MHATDMWKVNIISMSFGFDKFSSDIYKALDHAYKMDVVLFAAASNDGNASMNPLKFPASQKESVICVNAASAFGKPSEFNPLPAIDRDRTTFLGENVKSTWPRSLRKDEPEIKGGIWRRGSGTSVATPIAAAVAAAIMQFVTSTKARSRCTRGLKPKVALSRYSLQ
jgi:subtilisin family serine protease